MRKKIILDSIKEEIENGKNDEEILKSIVTFLSSMMDLTYYKKMSEANGLIEQGSRNLFELNHFTHLHQWGQNMLQRCVTLFEDNEINMKDILSLYKLQLHVSKLSIPEAREIFKEEWLKENFPDIL